MVDVSESLVEDSVTAKGRSSCFFFLKKIIEPSVLSIAVD